jgi:glycosyltransferase involved in cell wall biosynthesis
MNKEQIQRLISECNVFISLHRSEGFGFGPAEAMSLGKIVIATDYGGTKDFVNPETGFPIQYKLTPVGQQDYFHYENQVWADPDIDHAASVLQFIYQNYDQACKIAEDGRNSLCKTHSVDAVSKLIKFYSPSFCN